MAFLLNNSFLIKYKTLLTAENKACIFIKQFTTRLISVSVKERTVRTKFEQSQNKSESLKNTLILEIDRRKRFEQTLKTVRQ